MKKDNKAKLLLEITLSLAVVFQLARLSRSQDAAARSDKASETILDDVESGSFLEENSNLIEKTFGNNDVLRDFENSRPQFPAESKHGIPLKGNDNVEHLDSLLTDHKQLFVPQDVNSGLTAASINAVATDAPQSNSTLLDKMRTLMKSDVFSDLSMLDSLNWFDEDEHVFSPSSRVRRLAEPYRYRRFQQPLRAYVPEDSPVGTIVLRIPRNYEGSLEIVQPENPICRVNSQSGILETIERLDYERQKVYTLIIRDALNDTEHALFYNHDVIIYVIDVNDNEPTFNMATFSGHVNSGSRVGAPVAQLNASDPDGGVRGRIGFTVDDRNTPFTVNPKSWGLETNGKPLDPSQSHYPVNVRAFDEGYPRRESPTVVIDVRKADEPPRFSESAYTISYSEKILPGVIIGRVMAKSLSNIPVAYEVVPTSDVYGINARGELSLKRSVDYETAGSSATTVITVKASELTNDNPLSSQISVTLVVTNDDEYPTTFTEALYQAQIDEDISRGSLVTTVTVRDCDCANDCQCPGSEMRFTLLNTDDYFVVNEAGEIRTAKSFDYDIQNVFEFMVTAHHNLGNHGDQIPARAYVSVKLRDVNNHAPVFTQTLYHFHVDEDSDIGHHVGVVQATDRDTTASPLTYSIKDSVPRDGAFAITDQRFGILTVASLLNLTTQSSFTLTIEASDDLQSSETTVTIEVDDVNDNAPRFTTCPDSVNVEENVFVGARVTVLEAQDSDRGRNALLEYYIERSYDLFTSDHNEVFVINNATGEVKTAHALDRETKRYYFLIASARDGSHDSELRQVGYCQFVINVLDVNDNYPFFEVLRYETSVHQDTKVGSRVLKVQAIDDDIGVNVETTYSIDGRNDLFAVNSDGWITIKSNLRGLLGKKSFTITAKNIRAYVGKAKPDDTQKTTVEIVITDQSLPAFTQLSFQTQVSEDTLVGQTVLNVSAVASSPDRSMIYFLAHLRHTSEFPFVVDHATGSIHLASGLNFESRQKYAFSVNANEIGSLEPVEASIEIDVVDINDVAPIFGRSRYDGTVSEDAQPGAVVIRIRATDNDPQNVVITYEIEESTDSNLFELKKYPTSVEILAKQKFDREKTDNYHVILAAIDNGDPKLRSTAYVTVRVLDENDSPPVFDSAHYSVSVPENTPVGQTIETVITHDEDYGVNARTLFLIASGNDGRFRMTSEQMEDSSRGYLIIAKPLDYETRSEYNLTVVGSDKKFSNTTIITVKITNSDDDPPYFQQSLYNTSLAENTAPGTLVLVVEAIDNDSPSAHLVYNIDTPAAMYFVIGSNTGALTTSGTPLDHERNPVMVLSVTVSDGTNKARTFVEITVLDVNEPPRFPNPPYIGYIEENQPVGTPVRYVTAFDDDDPELNDGKNSNVSYSVVRNSGESTYDEDGQMFTIDPVSGLLRADAMFNLEVIRRNLAIQVRATDGGSPSLSTVTEVTIVVQDVSEFPPKFATAGYSTNVVEDTLVSQTVLTLTVVDEDFTTVGHRYSITNGNYPFAFYIQPKTGEILVAGILDYETTKEYNLTVSISERSMSKTFESDYASVLINILDANDQPPVFQPKSYYRKISEDVALGTEVRVVTCSDRDTGANAVPTFSITGGNIDDLFEVKSDPHNKNLGLVQVSGHLDKEKISAHTLEITATDIGGLTDTATLVVEVEDVNDTPPKFNPAYYEGRILGSVRNEQRVLTISATDADQAPNGGPLTFTLKNFEDKFQLKNPAAQTVDLYTNSIEFTRETTPLYQVIVEANDSGSPKLSAEAMIFVSVVDVEANQEPSDGFLTIVVFAQNGYFPGGTIGAVYYKDDDYKEDQNEYTVVSQEPGTYFTVDSTTGLIRCAANISDGVYSLNVTVRETSSTVGKVVSSKITVRVRSVNETAVQHSVALRFPLRTPALFINSLYLKLVETLAEIFLVSSDHVYVFSIGQSSGGVADSPYGVDVWIVIRSTGDEYMNPNYVFTQLEMNYNKLTALGVGKLEIGYDKCAAESKTVGVCKNILRMQKSFTVVSGYYGQVPAPSSSQTVVGIDTELRAIYEVLPEPAPDCSTMPCKNGGTCHDVVPQGFVCQCPPGFQGPECQVTTRTFNKPDSYIWLEPLAAYELSSISFEFMSETNIGNGLLLYQGPIRPDGNNGLNDFLAVSLLSGYITVAVSLGGRPSSFNSRKGERLDDGRWHHVEIKRAKKEIRLIIDHCETAVTTEEEGRFFEDRSSCEMVGHSFENFIYLNGLGPLQIGGSSLSSYPVSPVTTRSFYGCIRNIYDNHRMYDLRYPLRVVNSAVGCRHGCHSNPCQNGGYCESEMYSGSSCCTCVPGFTGCDCSEHSPSFWYLTNSFTKYNMTPALQSTLAPNVASLPGRKRRQTFPSFPRFSQTFFTQLVFRLRVHLGTSNAIFFRCSSKEDSFSELGMENKILYYTFKFADEMKTISLPGGSIDDDKWHNIHVRRQGNTASLQLDYKAKSYGTTGGIVRLVDYSGGSMYTGGIPRFVSEGSQLGSNGSLGVFDGKTNVSNVVGDFQGCTSATVYNGRELGEDYKFTQFRVVEGCPCTAVVDCKNNGTCVDEDPPYCLCPKGFTGRTCDEMIVVPTIRGSTAAPIAGFRSSSRHRFLDPVWLCIFLMSLIALIFLLCLLHTLAVVGGDRPLIEEDAHDSIMAYQGHGSEETDATGYDITLLMKHSRRQVSSSSYTASDGKFEEAGNQGMDAVDARGGAVGARRGGVEARGDDGRLESWIMERVSIADWARDFSSFPQDEMWEIEDEGKYSDVDDLSELEHESDEEREDDIDVFAIDWDNFVSLDNQTSILVLQACMYG